jgi:hypothetical protein
MGNNTLVVLPGKRRKKSNDNKNAKKAPPSLMPLEIKAAKAAYKNSMRKLAQSEMRKKLEEHTLIKPRAQSGAAKDNGERGSLMNVANSNIKNRQAQGLLLKSSKLGKKLTKKERLKQLHRKEVLGIRLTREEMDALYIKHIVPSPESFPENDMGVGDDDNDEDSGQGHSAKKKQQRIMKKNCKVNRDDNEQGRKGGGGNSNDMLSSNGGNGHTQLEQERGQLTRKKARSPTEESDALAPNETIVVANATAASDLNKDTSEYILSILLDDPNDDDVGDAVPAFF